MKNNCKSTVKYDMILYRKPGMLVGLCIKTEQAERIPDENNCDSSADI